MYYSLPKLLNIKIGLLVILLSLFAINDLKASHATGGEITYVSLGNGQYRVTFSFYRDCFGIDAPTTQTLNVSSSLCNFSTTYTMNPLPGTGDEITHLCNSALSTCQGGNETGVQQWQYSADVTLPAQCADWQFSTNVNARNVAITTIEDPDLATLFVDAFLNNTNGDNNSPTFSNVPIAFECIGQTNFFNQGVIDVDGDSLVYSFIAPRDDSNTPLIYKIGYSVANPLTSVPAVSINPTTGDITMNPTQPEVAVVAVLVEEYRNGVIIGTVMRDMQLYIVPCTNTLPTVTGINGGNIYITNSCVGGQICFDVISNDTDPNQVLTMLWNHGIPGATFDTVGSPNPVGHFCWTPTPADARPQPYQFSVIIRDDACPSNGVQIFSYSITVTNLDVQVTATPILQCPGSNNGIASATAVGVQPLQYLWTLPDLTTRTSTAITNLEGGPYTVTVTDASGCSGTEQFTIQEPAAIAITITPTNAGCGGSTGSASAAVTGGTPTYDYFWTPGGQTTAIATGLTTNTYTVRVTDDNNCTATASTTIQSNAAVNFTLHLNGATCVANDGSASVTHTGGVGPYSYVWTPDIPGNTTSSTITGLITGSYSVVATDLGTGCLETLSGIVPNLAGINATISSFSDASCESSEDGSATVVASGGQPPYLFLWPNGDTTATTNHLGVGTFIARVEDYNGCLAYQTVTINFVNPSPFVNLGLDTMPCTGVPYLMNAGGGFTTYLWNDNSTNSTLTVSTSGVYSVLVTNSNGCQAMDAIEVTFVTCSGGGTSTFPIGIASPVKVYPNPANSEINININRLRNTDVTVTVTNILGSQIFFSKEKSEFSYDKKVDVHTLPAGIYLIKVEYNNEISTTRIIKQ